MEEYVAHIRADGAVQTVKQHLEGTRIFAEEFGAAFGAKEQAAQAAMLHDIGKYSYEFQKHILHPELPMKVDHATAGAQVIGRISPVTFAVAGHHAGLPDGGSRADPAGLPTLASRLKKQVPEYGGWSADQPPPQAAPPPAFCKGASAFTAAFYTRMLYSCLVDADSLDTELFMRGQLHQPPETMPQLLEKLNTHCAGWETPAREIDRRRNEIRQACISAAGGPPGLYTLTVPTGGGKTVSSLAFALRHAVARQKNRIIYVAPFTSIIDQTAAVFQKILGEEAVLEHHSGIVYDEPETRSAADEQKLLATENWSAPVVVTTAVQFFESLFSNRRSRCRKLHNIAGSVVVFDEAQAIPVPYLAPCVAAISELVKNYGVTAVLCTATQPALDEMFADQGLNAQEICPDTVRLYEFFRRTELIRLGQLEEQVLAERLCAEAQVLCIVNRRKTAQTLFAKLPQEGSYCLSTLLCPADRKRLLEEIRRRLADGLPCRVVSTSLIEAGVDISFPVAYREETGLDSILQAAGRCNREGWRAAKESCVFVFSLGDSPPPMLRQNIAATQMILREFEDPSSPTAIAAYFDFFRRLKGTQALDEKGILDKTANGIEGNLCPFAKIAEQFTLIDSPVKTVYLPLPESEPLLERLRAGQDSRELRRKLGLYSVSIYPNHFAALNAVGALELLSGEDAILCGLAWYSRSTGLTLEPEGGSAYLI